MRYTYKLISSFLIMGFWPLVDKIIRNADILVLIGDARMPELSINKELERKCIRLKKPFIFVFNKIDLLNKEEIENLKRNYRGAFLVSGTNNIGIRELRRNLLIMAKRMKIEEPGIGVVGYPNVGKSAIINALAHRRRTEVADKPGTTRGIQWVKAGSLRILDTPGVIPYEDKTGKLVLIGSKSPDDISNPEKDALQIINILVKRDKKILEDKYKIETNEENLEESYDILLKIGKKRGFLKKKGEVDETKTAIVIIRDWQKGRLRV